MNGWRRKGAASLAALLLAAGGGGAEPDFEALGRSFAAPSMAERPRAIYLIPRIEWDIAGLAQDIRQMKEVGLGGAWYHDGYEGFGSVFGNFSYFPDKEGAPFMSPGHLAKLNGFLEEAARHDFKIVPPIRAMYMSGGPWIDQDHAAKEYTLSKTYVTGPSRVRVVLPRPAHRDADGVEEGAKKYYRDAAVVAWPVKADPRQTLAHRTRPVVSVSAPRSDAEKEYLSDGNALSFMNIYGLWLLPYGPRPEERPKETVISYAFPHPVEVASCLIALAPDKSVFPARARISASTDGVTFRTIADLSVLVGAEARAEFAAVTARWWQVTFPPLTNRKTMGVGEIEFLAPGERPVASERIVNFNLKSGRTCWPDSLATEPAGFYGSQRFYAPGRPHRAGDAIDRGTVRDLTSRLAPDGTLEWEVPAGTWCVMRFGHTLAKHGHVPARSGGGGYECDIYSAESARIQYENVPQRILRSVSPKARTALQGFWFTGFEMGPTNWTPKMREEFQTLAGYDLLPWLPALADEVVDGVEQTDAFLTDFRRTLHTLFAERHHATMKSLSTRDGLEFFSKTGVTKQANQDDLLYLSRAHVPSGESPGGRETAELGYDNFVFQPFGGRSVKGADVWWSADAQTKMPASASHIYGHSQIVAGSAGEGKGDHYFDRVPAFDKHALDRAFCMGVNQVYDGMAHDHRKGVYPGLHHWPWLDPRNTLFKQAAAFYVYTGRCQSLLQKGRFQADVAITQETAFHLVGRAASQTAPKVYVPKGYDYDFLSRELLLSDLRVENGRLKLSSGMSYAVLHIPDFANRLSVAGLRKIEALLQGGAVILAPKPVAGMTALDYADGLKQHRELAERLWAGLDGKTRTGRSHGKGRLYWGATLEEVLKQEKIRPDFRYEATDQAYVDHIHRRIEDTKVDFYFLANAVNRPAEIVARFRGQAGRTPHRFDPLSGEIRPLGRAATVGEDAELPLRLEAVGSAFIVFTDQAIPPPQARPASGVARAPVALAGPWQIEFRDMFGDNFRREFPTLTSFARSDDERVKYFSGEAEYRNRFELPAEAMDGRIQIDCGDVRWLAEIHVNGRKAGVMWSPPWRLDITPYCRAGENHVRIVCVNPWKNRLIGDSRRPEAERKTTITNFRISMAEFATMEPMEAGLLGPVRIVFGDEP